MPSRLRSVPASSWRVAMLVLRAANSRAATQVLMEMSMHKRVMDTNHARHLLELKEAFVAVGGQEDGAGGADGKQLRFENGI